MVLADNRQDQKQFSPPGALVPSASTLCNPEVLLPVKQAHTGCRTWISFSNL